MWTILRMLQLAFACFFLLYYVAICIITGGPVSAELNWIPICAVINLVCAVASQPKVRQRIRASLFPNQVPEQLYLRADSPLHPIWSSMMSSTSTCMSAGMQRV
mmetsp:Transcript_2075/g.4230  ORF Transcript_2075/g.4230 Transcript_2075/m.4230 type:complete len:104 (+) Transcript_2075:688-999(+)